MFLFVFVLYAPSSIGIAALLFYNLVFCMIIMYCYLYLLYFLSSSYSDNKKKNLMAWFFSFQTKTAHGLSRGRTPFPYPLRLQGLF